MHKSRLTAILALLLTLTLAGSLAAGGNRERSNGESEDRSVLVVGEVKDVVAGDGAVAVLTITTDEGPEVTIAVPARMAASLRIAPGDRFVSNERVVTTDTERLRVLEFTIERRR